MLLDLHDYDALLVVRLEGRNESDTTFPRNYSWAVSGTHVVGHDGRHARVNRDMPRHVRMEAGMASGMTAGMPEWMGHDSGHARVDRA
jgi:hypothetical protein